MCAKRPKPWRIVSPVTEGISRHRSSRS
jgi:hypothetical protein